MTDPFTTNADTIKKPIKKFKSQSVNNLFKSQLSSTTKPKSFPTSNHTQNSSDNFINSSIEQSLNLQDIQQLTNKGIKTLSLSSGPKLKIIPEKKFLSSLQSSSNSSISNGSTLFTAKLINDDKNYWKKSRSNSPDIKKLEPESIEPIKQLETSRFTFANLSLPLSSGGFSWADIDDDDEDTFNDKIWSTLNTQVEPETKLPNIQPETQLPNLTQSPIEKPKIFNKSSPSWNLDFRRHTSSSLNFNDSNNYQTNENNDYFRNGPLQRHSTSSLSTPHFDKISFNDSQKFSGSEPVKQELYNPITGKIEVVPNQSQKYINPKPDVWRSSNTVWNSRKNSINNSIPNEDFKTFSPKLTDSPNWSRNNSEPILDPNTLSTPNTLRGLSRFFPSPITEQQLDYFPLQYTMKRHSSDPNVPKRHSIPKLNLVPKRELNTRSQLNFDTPDDEEILISLPNFTKNDLNISQSTDTITQYVLNDSSKHPEGFSSTFYKRGINKFMFVRELQSKVAINKVKGYDYAEFRINIPISQKSMLKLMANQDQEHPNRIKRSYIINIDSKELEGKLRKGHVLLNGFRGSFGKHREFVKKPASPFVRN